MSKKSCFQQNHEKVKNDQNQENAKSGKINKTEKCKTGKSDKTEIMKFDQKKCQKSTPPQKPQNVT